MIRDQVILLELGRRLRTARERARLTVSELALEAGLSRRYVTEAEAGRANLSVLKLARLAHTLRTPLAELCDLPLTVNRSERIALVGLRGAGKTTLGARLALALDAPFVELDQRVERLAGMSLVELFDLHGVEAYRDLERRALEQVLAESGRVVIATGGSIVTSESTFARLRESCRTLWLEASPDEHLQRVLSQGDRRPVEGHPRAAEELREILERRRPLYALCEERLSTSGRSVEDVRDEALAWLAAST